jgi:hypothetical protein
LKKAIAAGVLALASLGAAAGCSQSSPADTVSHNLSNDADHFKVNRRITVINGITDRYLLTVEGRCSLGNQDPPGKLSITCEIGKGQYWKDIIGLSNNSPYVEQQLAPLPENDYHYKVNFRPSAIIPDIQG